MSLTALFYPKSIAVIGASTRVGSVGNEISKNLATQGYRGKLYLVNPKGGKLFGHKILTDLSGVKQGLDLAVIAIPAALVVEEVKKLVLLKVGAVIVISAGFGEAGNKQAEDELVGVCRDNDIALIGPNCLGVLNPDAGLNASFAPLMSQSGSIAFVSQSGAICASVLDYALRRELGFSKFVSVGNKAMIGEVELLEYLYKDPKTNVIAMYMEQLSEIEQLKQIALRVTQGKLHKPIVVLKAGRTGEGQKAALSHTGALGGSDASYEALFAQTGMIRAQTIEELFDIVECFVRNDSLKNNRVCVITNAGGPGVITADALVAAGLKLAKLSTETVAGLREFLPQAASVGNPVDVLGDADALRYKKTLELILADGGVDGVQVILTPQSMTEVEQTARDIVFLKKQTKKPIEVTFMGQGLVEEGVEILNKNKVATSYFPESGSKGLGALSIFQKWTKVKRLKPKLYKDVNPKVVEDIFKNHKGEKQQLLPMEEAFSILGAYGLPVAKRWVLTSSDIALALASKLDGLFVLKILSLDVNHKSDIGGVVLNVSPKDLFFEYEKLLKHILTVLPKAKIDGVEVMPMVSGEGIELIVGAKTDSVLGKQILVGLGGIYTEVFADVSWGLAPLTRSDIDRMVAHLKIARILSGFRGHKPLDAEIVVECLGRLSQLVVDFPLISEVDINPLRVMGEGKGAVVLDARMVLL
jgi:acetyltransferase